MKTIIPGTPGDSLESGENKRVAVQTNQSGALQNDLDEDTSDEMKKIITTIKDSGKELFVVYRGNDIYDKLVPIFTDTLARHQIPFTVKSFLKGTDEREIKQWIEAHRNEYIEKIFISDATCDYDYDCKNKERNSSYQCYLDSLCNRSVKKFYKEKFPSNKKERSDLECEKGVFDKLFIHLIQQCLTHEQPEEIYVATEYIDSHGTGEGVGYRLGVKSDDSSYDEKRKEMQIKVAEKIVELVKKAGYTGTTIIGDGSRGKHDREHNRYIYDRHMQDWKKPVSAKSLELPFTNLLSSMKKYGFLTDMPSHHDLTRDILEKIASEISPKE